MDGFVHLHVHSHYSLLDGAIRIGDLVKTAAAFEMPAVALTDHGHLFGAVDFHDAARKAGIKPILGMEAYISPTRRDDHTMGNIQTAAYHLILLAMNRTGWRNLVKLASRAYLEGFYYRPRIDRDLLSELSDGNFQKAIIGRALAQDTAILVLDEPTIHLDVNNKTIIKVSANISPSL